MIGNKVTEQEVEDSLNFYRDNAKKKGMLQGRKAYYEHKVKIVLSQMFLSFKGTVAEREHMAKASKEYAEAVEDLENCIADLDTVWTLLKAAELKIEVWRSQNASSRRAHV